MVESWRHILERAAANLSIELNEGNVDNRHPQARRQQAGSSNQQFRSAAQSRDLLARELEGLSAQPAKTRPIQARMRPPRTNYEGGIISPTAPRLIPPQPLGADPRKVLHSRKSGSWRKLAVVSFSSAIIGLTGYVMLNQGNAKNEGTPVVAGGGDTLKTSLSRDPTLGSLSRATEAALLERAANQLSNGDVGARNTYEFVAQSGSARGAFALAETYDSNFLARHREWGLKPDPRLARKWYERAAELGNPKASERLKAFEPKT